MLELFCAQSLDGFFFMMLDEPVEWGEHVNKGEVMDYVCEHQRMTKVNSAILTQFKASSPEELLGMTPAQDAAAQLRLSAKAASTYRARLLEKMGLKSKADLVRYVVEHGLLI